MVNAWIVFVKEFRKTLPKDTPYKDVLKKAKGAYKKDSGSKENVKMEISEMEKPKAKAKAKVKGGAIEKTPTKYERQRDVKNYKKNKTKVEQNIKDGIKDASAVEEFKKLANELRGDSKTNNYAKAIKVIEKKLSGKAFVKKSDLKTRQLELQKIKEKQKPKPKIAITDKAYKAEKDKEQKERRRFGQLVKRLKERLAKGYITQEQYLREYDNIRRRVMIERDARADQELGIKSKFQRIGGVSAKGKGAGAGTGAGARGAIDATADPLSDDIFDDIDDSDSSRFSAMTTDSRDFVNKYRDKTLEELSLAIKGEKTTKAQITAYKKQIDKFKRRNPSNKAEFTKLEKNVKALEDEWEGIKSIRRARAKGMVLEPFTKETKRKMGDIRKFTKPFKSPVAPPRPLPSAPSAPAISNNHIPSALRDIVSKQTRVSDITKLGDRPDFKNVEFIEFKGKIYSKPANTTERYKLGTKKDAGTQAPSIPKYKKVKKIIRKKGDCSIEDFARGNSRLLNIYQLILDNKDGQLSSSINSDDLEDLKNDIQKSLIANPECNNTELYKKLAENYNVMLNITETLVYNNKWNKGIIELSAPQDIIENTEREFANTFDSYLKEEVSAGRSGVEATRKAIGFINDILDDNEFTTMSGNVINISNPMFNDMKIEFAEIAQEAYKRALDEDSGKETTGEGFAGGSFEGNEKIVADKDLMGAGLAEKIHKAVAKRKDLLHKTLDKEDRIYYDMSKQSYRKPNKRKDIGGYDYNDELSDNENAVYINDSDKKIIVAFRGSVNIKDFKTDVSLAMGGIRKTDRYDSTKNLVATIKEIYPNYKISFSGHSLGGTLAVEMADLSPNHKSVVFNSAHTPLRKGSVKDKDITYYSTSGDLVSALGLNAYKNVKVIDSDKKHPLTAHSLKSMEYNADDKCDKNDYQGGGFGVMSMVKKASIANDIKKDFKKLQNHEGGMMEKADMVKNIITKADKITDGALKATVIGIATKLMSKYLR